MPRYYPFKERTWESKQKKLEKINKVMVQHLNVNHWKNLTSVIKWFTVLENKTDYAFIKFDIQEFDNIIWYIKLYPAITVDILKTSLSFPNKYQNGPEEDIRIINHCRKSLLFSDNQLWQKNDSEGYFDVTMGSYDGAEICKLSPSSTIIDKNHCGLYRYEGLLSRRNVTGQQIDHVRKNVIQLFKDIGFLIDIVPNLKISSI